MDTLRVLVTDDEPGMRLGVRRILAGFRADVPDLAEKIAFEVSDAEDGEAALKRIESDPPDILLLDHKMPKLNGIDLLDRLRGRNLEMLTIMITAYASIETAIAATKRGAYDFLAKPFTPDELRATVAKAAQRLMLARRTRALSEERRQVRFKFVRMLAHELKAPLDAVDGYLGMMLDRTAGDGIAAYDDMVHRSQTRIEGMRKLITDLLDMTRIESGHKRRRLEQLDLAALARDVLDSFRPRASQRGVSLELHAPAVLEMTADRGELEMLLGNLVSNAVKYNRQDGRVHVTLGRTEDRVTLAVRDTGIGLSPEETKRLFDDFVRIRKPETHAITGSGLGLSIVKKLVDLYGGEVGIVSEPGAGSTFTATLYDTAEVPEDSRE
ncbi:MAG: HAMP domain-containing sensor histidine kinase, partial [Patescibacteria group bacterium]|nr:HAMP domain-containing sensor histidine kinase [Patescibacteria group bacterium]